MSFLHTEAMTPTALTAHGEELHLLLSIPDDSLIPHERQALAYLHFDGQTWTHRTTLHNNGLFLRTSVLADDKGGADLFWAGDPPEALPPSPTDDISLLNEWTTLFHCKWEGNECKKTPPLFSSKRNRWWMRESVRDDEGNAHLVFLYNAFIYHLILRGEQAEMQRALLGLYPRLQYHDKALFLAYVDTPQPPRHGANDLYYRSYRNGTWSDPVLVYHDPERTAHVPTIAIDLNGVHHLAWMVLPGDGEVLLFHATSNNEGLTWSEPEQVFSIRTMFARAPMMAVDGDNTVHLVWGHWHTPPEAFIFYASYRDGKWSEPEEPFKEIPITSPPYMALDALDRIHVVWVGEKAVYHSMSLP